MKKIAKAMLLTAMLAMIIAVFAIPTSAAANTSAYIQVQSGSVSHRILGSDLTAGEVYTISARMKVEEIEANGGFAYISWYEFVSPDMSPDVNANYEAYGANLGQWRDWAQSSTNTTSNDDGWIDVTSDFTLGANCGHLRIQLGFYLATGTLSVDDIKIVKKSDGTEIFFEDWEDGYDASIWSNKDDNGQETDYVVRNYTAPVVSEPDTSTATPETGDSAIVFVVLAVISLAGAFVVKKVR